MYLNSNRYRAKVLACLLSAVLWLPLMLRAENKVLFVGNSFTIGPGGNITVPDIFDALANAGGHEDPTTVMCATGGKDFQYHYDNNQAYFTQEPWTHVVLQNYSTQPTHVGDVDEHMTYGALLYDSIISNNADAQVMLFMTWARAAVHSIYTGTSTSTTFESPDEMISELSANYHALAEELTNENLENLPVLVNPVGEAWENAGGYLTSSDTDFFDLYGSDDYHGNWYGYYLTACVHYSSIYGVSPEGLYPISGLKAKGLSLYGDRAAYLETVAWRTVADSGMFDQSIRIDFGADNSTTASTAGDTWNNVRESQASVDGGVLSDLQTTTGQGTGIDLTVVSRFNASDVSGSAVSSALPSSASSDSLYGNTASENGLSDLTPTLKLSDLDVNTAYRFSFYASRSSGSDNLQTHYAVTGAEVVAVDLNVHDNVDTIARTMAIFPDSTGEITIELSPGADNDSALLYTSLGALVVDLYPNSELSFDTQPLSQSVEEGGSVTFSASVLSSRSTEAQWYCNGVAIAGATDLSYTIDSVSPAQDGAEYMVTVSNGIVSLSSEVVSLGVIADLTAPTLESLERLDDYTVKLRFSESMVGTNAGDASLYQLANRGHLLNVTDVSFSGDGLSATLTLASSVDGNMVLAVSSEMTDSAGNPMADHSVISYAVDDAESTIYIDFSSSNLVTGVSEAWNVVSPSSAIRGTVGNGTGLAYEFTSDLLYADGNSSNIALTMTDAMTNANNYGTVDTSAPYPEGAVVDAYYGHKNGITFDSFDDNGQGIFVFSGLDTDLLYDFTFFASRTGVSDNRETTYVLNGANSGSVSLDAANNVSNSVAVLGIEPDVSGEITLLVRMGDNNTSNYYYINALEINVESADGPVLYPPVWLNGHWVIDWTGDVELWKSYNLSENWEAFDPPVSAPYMDDMDAVGRCFYRVE